MKIQQLLQLFAFALLASNTPFAQFISQRVVPGTETPARTAVQRLAGSSQALHVIDEPGSYLLLGNLQGVSGKHGILVNAPNVTIDLMGFVLSGTADSNSGIAVGNGASGLVLKNGTITGWGGSGVESMGNAVQARLERIRAIDNGGTGLAVEAGSSVELCLSVRNVNGIFAREARVEASLASENSSRGVWLVGSASARRTMCRDTGDGYGRAFLLKEGGSSVTECVAAHGNVRIESGTTQRVARLSRSVISGSPSSGVQVTSSSLIEDNLSTGHTFHTFHVTTGGHHIEGNLSTNSGPDAFSVYGQGVVIRNASVGNAQNDNWDFTGGVAAGSFLSAGEITSSNGYGHPLHY